MLINLREEVDWVMNNRFRFYSPEDEFFFLSSSKFKISAKHVNYKVWYNCYILDGDFKEYDFSSMDLKEVLEWCNDLVPKTFMYY